jgi:hypothetical protein
MKNHMNRMVKTSVVLAAACLLAVTAAAIESPPDIGIVTRLSGKIAYWNETLQEVPKDAQGFMKVRQTDHLELTPEAEVQLVFFSNGRRENWKGPVHIKLSETGAQAIGGEKSSAPQVAELPYTVVREFKWIAAEVDPSKLHRSGSVLVRDYKSGTGNPPKKPLTSRELKDWEKSEIEIAKQTYQDMSQGTDAGDITAELYLFSVLAFYHQYQDIIPLIDTMRKKQPENSGIDRLEEWLASEK